MLVWELPRLRRRPTDLPSRTLLWEHAQSSQARASRARTSKEETHRFSRSYIDRICLRSAGATVPDLATIGLVVVATSVKRTERHLRGDHLPYQVRPGPTRR